MFPKRLHALYLGAGACAAVAFLALPATPGSAAEMVAAPVLTYDLDSTAPTTQQAELGGTTTTVDLGEAYQPAFVETHPAPRPTPASVDDAERICMAKVVLHEAGNQPYAGKVAVAQTLVNRMKDGRFGGSICEVAGQPGQFFNVTSYSPRRNTEGWADAVDIADSVLRGEANTVVPGAMFFRAGYAPTNSFFRGRKRIAQVGAHIFYR